MASNSNARPTRDSPPRSPTSPSSPSSSTPPSRQGHQYRPSQPSLLRRSHMPSSSPEDDRSNRNFEENGVEAQDHAPVDADIEATRQHATMDYPSDDEVNARTALLHNIGASHKGDENGDHGTFSPRPRHGRGYGSFGSSYAGTESGSFHQNRPSLGGRVPTDINTSGIVPDSITDGLLGRPKKRGTTHWLAERAGIKHERIMYVESISHVFSQLLASFRRKSLTDSLVGTFTTIYPSPIGYDSIAGNSCEATLSLR